MINMTKKRGIWGAGLFLFLLLGLALTGYGLFHKPTPVAASPLATTAQWEDELLRITNIDRTSNGLSALMPQGTLQGLARDRSSDMIERQYFSHDIPPGKNAGDLIGDKGIPYERWGENIGYSSGHDQDIVSYLESKWMASEGHRANILNPKFTHFGPGAAVGTFKNVNGVKMFTELFLQSNSASLASTPVPPTAAPQAPAAPVAAAQPPASSSRTFAETGKMLSGLFLDYWNNNGALPQQGFPISAQFNEVSPLNGQTYTVQYFERAVFEYHPENPAPYNVLLSQLGTFRYKMKYPQGAPSQMPNQDNGKYFAETGHWVGGKFWQYWQQHGGLAQQGYPLSDEFIEVSDLDGKPYMVQYFERSVMEFHPENSAPNDILLSQLGTFQYRLKYPGN